ncbi:hypothetical protein HHK36_019732 [Tetracentron sinense]|uniref:Uncharacterized protein n=1 Tax=Tetracentron sinense TaxID=13715 RepID=A0A834Z1V1_TETSI|nr:hypothetical protein HHK36_019732 [Tetracentron sinense]
MPEGTDRFVGKTKSQYPLPIAVNILFIIAFPGLVFFCILLLFIPLRKEIFQITSFYFLFNSNLYIFVLGFLLQLESIELLIVPDKNEVNSRTEVAEYNNPITDVKDVPKQDPGASENVVQVNTAGSKAVEKVTQGASFGDMDASGEVNMEASIMPDDVIRAGGFGARDDISSFLPVAIDSTDFEASLRDARDYEEPQGEACRPGLGWTDASEAE